MFTLKDAEALIAANLNKPKLTEVAVDEALPIAVAQLVAAKIAGDFTSGLIQADMEAYRKIPAISQSGLARIARSPAHYIAYMNEQTEPTPAMIFGAAMHAAVFEAKEFAKRYAACPEGMRRDKRTKEYQEFLAANEGKTILTQEEFAKIDAIQASVGSHPEVSRILSAGAAEQAFLWKDPETGLKCKGRADWLRNDGVIVDLKTCEDASFEGFQRKSLVPSRIHVQAAFYTDAMRVIGMPSPGFIVIAVEKEPPYAVALYVLDDATIEKGRELYRRDLAVYAECLKTDKWPSYPEQIQTLNLPHYAW